MKGKILNPSGDPELQKFLNRHDYDSAHQVAAVSEEHFVESSAPHLGENGEEKARQIYADASGVQAQAMHLFANASQLAAPHTQAMAVNHVHQDLLDHFQGMPDYEELFGNQNYCDCAECKSIFGAAAYFVDLMRIADRYATKPNTIETGMTLRARRPDLFQIKLTCENTNRTMPYLKIVNERLEAVLSVLFTKPYSSVYQYLMEQSYPFQLPFNLPLERIRIYLKRLNVKLSEIFELLSPPSCRAEALNLSTGEWNILTAPATGNSTPEYFGAEFDQLINVEVFSRQTGLKIKQIQDLLFQNLSEHEKTQELSRQFFINQRLEHPLEIKTEGDSVTIANLSDGALYRIHRFLRLANKLGWSYSELDWALHCANNGVPEIDEKSLVGMTTICNLKAKLNITIEAVCELLFDLKTYGVGEDETTSEAPFDRIFNGAGMETYHPKDEGEATHYSLNPLYTDDVKLWKIGAGDDANKKMAARVAAGLGLGQDDLLTLARFVFKGQQTISLTVGNLSLIYRHVKLSSIVRLPVEQYVLMMKGLGKRKTSLKAGDIIEIVDQSNRLRRSGLNVYELDYIALSGYKLDADYIAATDPESFVNIPYRKQVVEQWFEALPKLIKDDANRRKHLEEQLASLFSCDAKQIEILLALLQQTSMIKPTDDVVDVFLDRYSDISREFVKSLSRWLVLVRKLQLTNDEIDTIRKNKAVFGISDPNFPSASQVLTIIRFKQLRDNYGDAAGNVLAYISAAEADTAKPAADLTGQNQKLIEQLERDYKSSNRFDRLDRVRAILDLIKKTGADLDFLYRLADFNDKDFFSGTDAADTLLSLVRARFDAGAWETVHRQMEGEIQELKRAALVRAAVCELGKREATSWIKNSRNLYEYLLIDVEMSGCAQISYIREALNAMQMYLLRCRQHLEPGVDSFTVPSDWWQWLSNYRVWEANRKVFLYPENYIDPAFRSTKTQLFKDLENTLKQGDINQDTVEKAFKKYLDDFAELATLKYVDAHFCHVSDSSRDDAPTLFLIARTAAQPYKYYYITREGFDEEQQDDDSKLKGVWSEWKAIDVTINAEEVSAVYAFNKLFIFWIELKSHNEGSSNDKKGVQKATIKYSFHNFNGDWSQPQTLLEDAIIYANGSLLDVSKNQQNAQINYLMSDKCFDTAQPWWRKVYPVLFEKGSYTVPNAGANKFDKLVIFYGPIISASPTSIRWTNPQATSDSVEEFDEQLVQSSKNISQVCSRGTTYTPGPGNSAESASVPVFPQIVLNNDLTVGYLAKPNEILFFRRDPTDIGKHFRPVVDVFGNLHLTTNKYPTDWFFSHNYMPTTGSDVLTNVSSLQNDQTTQFRHIDASLFTVHNHLQAFVFNADKEAFLFLPFGLKKPAINRSLFNSDIFFKEQDFPQLGVMDRGKVVEKLIYEDLRELGYINEKGRIRDNFELQDLVRDYFTKRWRLTSETIIDSARTLSDQELSHIIKSFLKLGEYPNPSGDTFQSLYFQTLHVIGILLRSPYIVTHTFISSKLNIDYSQADKYLTALTSNRYVTPSLYRRTVDIDLDNLITILKDATTDKTNVDEKVKYVIDSAYQCATPSGIGFFDSSNSQKKIDDIKFDAVRLTTSAVHKLSSSLFTGGIDKMLSLNSQQIPVETGLPFERFQFSSGKVNQPEAIDGTQVDFSGAYGNYYWELFFHAPFYIANLLKSNQRFEEAEKWYQYIFNPTLPEELIDEESFVTSSIGLDESKEIYHSLLVKEFIKDGLPGESFDSTTDLSTPLASLNLNDKKVASIKNILLNHQLSRPVARFWQFQPFRSQSLESLQDQLQSVNEINAYNENPFDPHAIARLRIGAYEKAIVMQYVDNLLQWGDAQFTQYTWESLVTATMLYVYAYNLLGERPENLGDCPTPTPHNFDDIYNRYQNDIPQFFMELEKKQTTAPLPIAFTPINTLDTYFGVPENADFIAYWDKVEDRLYKIRHCLNLQGVKQSLSLFESPIDPMQLVRAASAGGSILSILQQNAPEAPYYRFNQLLERAKNFAGVLSQLGSTLLTTLEKKDAEALANLRATHEKVILNLTTLAKERQIDEINAIIESLKNAQNGAQLRHDRYQDWYNENISALEIADLTLRAAALVPQDIGVAIDAIAIAGYLSPSVYGLADGGMDFGNAVYMGAAIAEGVAGLMNQAAGLIGTAAQYERRRDEWELQRDMAQYEIDQIGQQIASNEVRVQILQRELDIHQKSIEQADEYEDFLKGKFTNEDLYQWMISRLSTLYFQTYQMTLEIAAAAQTAYQNETNRDEQFLQFDYWDSLHRGLLAGEGLLLTLNQMEKAYLENHKRTLEIEKTVSLLHLDPAAFLGFRTGINGKTKGKLSFNLSESLFDFDFPGHYCRKIKSVSVTIPAVIGPYQNINATLIQNSNKTILKPDIEAVKQVMGIQNGTAPDGSLKQNWMPSQQIALSRGVDDSGLFLLDFRDERYLPFEGTGAVSEWTLCLPPETNHFDFNSISDVIVKIRYTALDGSEVIKGGVTFDEQVKSLHTGPPSYPYMPIKFIDLKQVFASEWQRFISSPPQNDIQQISFPLTDNVILPNLKNLSLKSVAIGFHTPEGTQISAVDVQNPFLKIKIGDSEKSISVNKNYGVLAETPANAENCNLIFTLGNAPAVDGLIVNNLLNPNFLKGIVVIIIYQSNVFGKSVVEN